MMLYPLANQEERELSVRQRFSSRLLDEQKKPKRKTDK